MGSRKETRQTVFAQKTQGFFTYSDYKKSNVHFADRKYLTETLHQQRTAQNCCCSCPLLKNFFFLKAAFVPASQP